MHANRLEGLCGGGGGDGCDSGGDGEGDGRSGDEGVGGGGGGDGYGGVGGGGGGDGCDGGNRPPLSLKTFDIHTRHGEFFRLRAQGGETRAILFISV